MTSIAYEIKIWFSFIFLKKLKIDNFSLVNLIIPKEKNQNIAI